MANKTIGSLPAANTVGDSDLFVCEQQGEAKKTTGAQWKAFAVNAVQPLAAQEYSGKPPIIQDDTWWTWNAEKQEYENTGENAKGDVMFATFEIDPETGLLTMTTPDMYDGPVFSIVNGYLEVSISA